MNRRKQIQRFYIVVALLATAISWGANRLDMFTSDQGDPGNALDDWDRVSHTFISDQLQPFQLYLYVDSAFNAIDPAVNINAVPTWLVVHGIREAVAAWNNVSISSFEFDEGVTPFSHTFAKFPGQTLVPGATGLDGWNLVTFMDPALSTSGGIIGLSYSWKFWRDFDLGSFINLPPGIIIIFPPEPNPPGGAAPAGAQIDFNLDGFPDVIIEARKYMAGETIEGDMWFSQIEAWHQWPDDPDDLITTSGGTVTRPATLGTLDIQGTVTHELGHLMGIGHTNIERATMYYALKGPYNQGFRYPTDVWDQRSLDLDDEIAASLIYPRSDRRRGAIAGGVFDGRNFDGLPDRTSGVIDAILYGTVYVTREMTSPTIPAYVPDKFLLTTAALTQQQLDTSTALYLEVLTEIQTGDNIGMALWPNPASLQPTGLVNGQSVHIEALPNYHIPGLHPFDRYIILLDNQAVYYNDSAGVATDNISLPFTTFLGYQTIPTEFYGGNMDPAARSVLGPDGAIPFRTVTTQPLTVTGDIPTSYVYVPVAAGQITGPINIYTNTGGLPPGVTPTPIPGITPTPPPIGDTRFAPDMEGDIRVPASSEFGIAAAVGDIDNDSDMDLYICNAVAGSSGGGAVSLVNRLYLNDRGDEITRPTSGPLFRRFVDVTFGPDNIAGTADDRLPMDLDLSFGAVMADFDLDGYVDIFVTNSESLNHPYGAENRLYLNRGWNHTKAPGWFDDVTSRPRTDPAMGIPTTFTATIVPGILNIPPFMPLSDPRTPPLMMDYMYGDILNRATKPDCGDIDSDGDIDIVIATMNLFTDPEASFSPNTAGLPLFFSERILINHANDFDPRTRGFYFTDETLGLDCRFGEATAVTFPLTTTWTARQAMDRMPPMYPDLVSTPDEQDYSRSYQVVLAPLFGDGSLDMVVFNRSTPAIAGTNHDGFDAVYENIDIDGDGVQDGYFRFVNAGSGEFGYMTVFDSGATTVPNMLALNTWTGTGGIGIFDGDPGDAPAPETNAVVHVRDDSFGGAVGDFNYFGFNMPLSVNGTAGHTVLTLGGAGCSRGPIFGGQGLTYDMYAGFAPFSASLIWQFMTASGSPLTGFSGSLARHAAVADFDGDGDFDVYIGFQKQGAENVFTAPPAPNQYFANNGFAAFTNATAIATSPSARGTYHVLAFDFENDGDPDIFQTNTNSQSALVLNRLCDGPPDLHSSIDNPLWFDATPLYLPPYSFGQTAPPFSGAESNMSVSCAVGDLTGDDLPDVVVANGALFTANGDNSDVLINHGQPRNAGTTVMSPLHASFPAPKIASAEWYRFGRFITGLTPQSNPPYDVARLNVYTPAYGVVMADFDGDGDYDVMESTLGNGPKVYSNEDSADVAVAWNDVLSYPFLQFTERALNSIPDKDFLGDGILIPADTPGSLFSMQPLQNPHPVGGGTNKKMMNRGLAIGDVDNNGTIDVVIANGLPRAGGGGGAPNVLLLNRSDAQHTALFVDVTETHLPLAPQTYMSGTQRITYYEGINDDTLACALADFDSNGKLDLMFVNGTDGISSPTRYLTNTGGGHFVDAPADFLPPITRLRGMPWGVLVADFDGRGDPTEDKNGNGVLDPGEDVNHNGVLDWWDTTESEDLDGDGVLDPGEDGLAPFGPPNGRLDSADLNGDGEITVRYPGVFDASWDVLITMQDGPDVLLLNSLPNPQHQFYFIDASDRLPAVWLAKFGGDVGDIDLDGDLDVVVGCRNPDPRSGRVVVYLNELNTPLRRFTDASYEVPRPYSIAPATGFSDAMHFTARDVKLGDFDLDGDLDMYAAYTGTDIAGQPLTAGATNVVYVNRLIGENFNSLRKFRTYQSPFLIKLSPQAGMQGTTVEATFLIQKMDGNIRSVNFGPGIAVGPAMRLAATAFRVQLRIANNAPIGPHDVTVTTTFNKTTQLREAFTVLTRPTSARPTWLQYR
jgi:hypothetical protein